MINAEALKVSYGPVTAVRGIDLTVSDGEASTGSRRSSASTRRSAR